VIGAIVKEMMMTNRITLTLATAAVTAATWFALPAQAANGVEVGVLKCSEQEGWGLILGGSQALNCRFDPNNGRPSEWYTGHVSKLGLDIGHTKGGTITWAVIAPASNLDPGALQGTYGGLTASLAVGSGAGASAMIGGFDRAIQLQPLSIEGLHGTEVAAGLGAIDLKFRGVG
jgi:hypothetical protein